MKVDIDEKVPYLLDQMMGGCWQYYLNGPYPHGPFATKEAAQCAAVYHYLKTREGKACPT